MKKIIIMALSIVTVSINVYAQHQTEIQVDSLKNAHRITYIGDGDIHK